MSDVLFKNLVMLKVYKCLCLHGYVENYKMYEYFYLQQSTV